MKTYTSNVCTRTYQRGVGIIEILVTVLLLSIGFLVAAQMQVQGMRFSQSAYHQSQAYFLASDMMNRMRTNIDGVINGNYDDITTAGDAINPNCGQQACSPEQLAQQDIYDWSSYFHEFGRANFIPSLPSSTTVVAKATVTPIQGQLYSVNLTWNEVIDGEDREDSLRVNFAVGDQ